MNKAGKAIPAVVSVVALVAPAAPAFAKTKPKKKYVIPVPNPLSLDATEATGAKSVTPRAKKKNQSGVLTNSPMIHAGYRK